MKIKGRAKKLKDEIYVTGAELENGDDDTALLGFAEDVTSDNSAQYFRWTPESTRLMLQLRSERHAQFQQNVRQKKEIWAEIAHEMQVKSNYNVTGEACDLKYRNMLQTYKKNRIKEERGLQALIAWEYYDFFNEITKTCGTDNELMPTMLCESVCVGEEQATTSQDVQESTEKASDVKKSISPKANNRNRNLKIMKPNRENVKAPSSRLLKRRLRLLSDESEPETTDIVPANDWNHAPIVEQKPDIRILESTVNTTVQQPTVSIPMRQKEMVGPPSGLSASEFQECLLFGDTVGLQLAHVKEQGTRALLQLNIQKMIYEAKMGKLTEK